MFEITNYSSNKISHNIKDNEEKRANERKRNILYLISNYLYENGFHDSASTLASEAQLSNCVEVCDNVDLETILTEYTNYYFMKFKKYPKICKKRVDIPERPATTINANKTVRSKQNLVKPCSKPAIKKNEKDDVPSMNFIITPLTKINNEEEKNLDTSMENEATKPLHEFSGFTSEWKEMADMISKEVVKTDLRVYWSDVKGLNDCINCLKEAVIYPIIYPKLFLKISTPWKGILLYGPPGTGKTMIAKALATECKTSTFFNMTPSNLISKWRGDSEKLIKVLFELARFQVPSILFFDEIDALASKRDEHQHDASRRFKSEFLMQLDGLNSINEDVFILATTNVPWDLDPAILRRFEKRILIDYPSDSAREEMFRYYLNKMTDTSYLKNKHYSEFARLTENYSGSDIKIICKEAAFMPIRKEIKTNNANTEKSDVQPITFEDVLSAINNIKPYSVNQKYIQWHKEHGHM